MKRLLAIVLMLLTAPVSAQNPVNEGDSLWRITTLRAAPGQWRELKLLIERQGDAGMIDAATGRLVPYRMRHSQGDHWDFMLLQPIADLPSYFSEGPAREAERLFRSEVAKHADFSQDWFASGPDAARLQRRIEGAGLFHVEMFRARAGLHDELLDQRQRENIYYAETGRPGNAIFTGRFGADWDNMTIGFHKNLKAFSAGSGLSAEAEEKAARNAGFDGTADLAPYLRSLLVSHNDTLAVAMN